VPLVSMELVLERPLPSAPSRKLLLLSRCMKWWCFCLASDDEFVAAPFAPGYSAPPTPLVWDLGG
jgi:hypothetical protein